jgi:hypothetical protein
MFPNPAEHNTLCRHIDAHSKSFRGEENASEVAREKNFNELQGIE